VGYSGQELEVDAGFELSLGFDIYIAFFSFLCFAFGSDRNTVVIIEITDYVQYVQASDVPAITFLFCLKCEWRVLSHQPKNI